MASLYLPIRALNRSQAVRIGRQRITATTTAYIDINDAKTRKELAYHSSIGAIYVVGPASASNSNSRVVSGGVVTAGTGLRVLVSTGEIKNSSTGAYVVGAADPGSGGLALTTADGTNPRIDLVVWDGTSGALSKVDGVAAAVPVAPAVPAGKVPLATVAVATSATAPGTITDIRPRA